MQCNRRRTQCSPDAAGGPADGPAHGDASLAGAHPASELVDRLEQALACQGRGSACGSGGHGCRRSLQDCKESVEVCERRVAGAVRSAQQGESL